MKTVTTNPPANASIEKSEASLNTCVRDRSSRAWARSSISITPLSRVASHTQTIAPIGNSRNHRRSAGAPAHT